MDWSKNWPSRVASALGCPEPAPGQRLGAGARRITLGGQEAVVKLGEGALDEAAGLRDLAAVAGAPPVPAVLLAEPGLLVTGWVEQATRTAAHEELLGRMLAALHARPWSEWGGGSSWIGECRVDPFVAADAAAFYRARLLELARRCGLEGPVTAVTDRLEELLPPGEPALVHGDLWWGNVLWGADGRPWLIDPSTHGGHPEEDLAMLALFGVVPDRLLGAYAVVAPLASGWEERIPLFQLYPLLVHTVLFGGSYRTQVEAVCRRYR
ncbi:MAG: fructosamine kinase family protein [Acidimicrobiales bacterium]